MCVCAWVSVCVSVVGCVCVCVCVWVCLWLWLCVCLSVYLCLCGGLCVCVCVSESLSMGVSHCLWVCFCFCGSMSIFVSVFLSVRVMLRPVLLFPHITLGHNSSSTQSRLGMVFFHYLNSAICVMAPFLFFAVHRLSKKCHYISIEWLGRAVPKFPLKFLSVFGN